MIRGRGRLDAVRRQKSRMLSAKINVACRAAGRVAGDRLRLDADHAEEMALRVDDGRAGKAGRRRRFDGLVR